MRDRLAIRLLKAAFHVREEVETFHRIFHRRVFRDILNGSDDYSLLAAFSWRVKRNMVSAIAFI